MKIFTFIRMMEFLNVLLNKFNKDYDVQLFSILTENKIKKKIINFILLLFSLSLNIVTFWSYMISLSIVLNDPNNFIFPLFIKLNYISLKKSGKQKKLSKILDVVLFEIYDRFFVFLSLFLVIIQNYSDNKINSHNFVDYAYRVFFLVGTEILFDWMKNIVTFKISDIKPSLIKSITYDMILMHEKCRYRAFHLNGASNCPSSLDESGKESTTSVYIKIIEQENLQFFNQKSEFQRYANILDADNIICLELQNNILIYTVIVKINFIIITVYIL